MIRICEQYGKSAHERWTNGAGLVAVKAPRIFRGIAASLAKRKRICRHGKRLSFNECPSKRLAMWVAALSFVPGLGGTLVGTAAAQEAGWPNRPVKFIVGYPAGGPADVAGRLYAEIISKSIGQPIYVENRSGAGGTIGALAAVRSDPDGYTFYVGAISDISLGPALSDAPPYDPLKDLEPVAFLTRSAYILVAAPSFPANTLRELIDYAKANPGKVSYASVGYNTIGHVYTERFKLLTGIDALHIPYRGSAGTLSDLASGQVHFSFENPTTAVPLIKGGNIKALAVAHAERFASLPQVQTMAEAGVPFTVLSWNGVFAPAKTPRPIIDRMNREMNAAATSETIRNFVDKASAFTGGGTVEDFRDQIASEIREAKELASRIGLKPPK